jgi:hypothetical protein
MGKTLITFWQRLGKGQREFWINPFASALPELAVGYRSLNHRRLWIRAKSRNCLKNIVKFENTGFAAHFEQI